MADCDLHSSVTDWVIDHPKVLSLFQELGIDYCCGGKSLRFACLEQNLDPLSVLKSVRVLLESTAEKKCDETDAKQER